MSNIITSPVLSCSACGSEGYTIQANVTDPDGEIPGEWNFRKCSNRSCELVWLDPAPLQSELWKAYATYHTHTHASSNLAVRLILSFTNRLARMVFFPIWASNGLWRETNYLRYMMLKNMPAGKLLDVGCGGGRFMNRMKRLGWEVEGIDFDEKATSKIARRYGMKTYTGDLAACALPESSYDAITMSHTIEHLFDPKTTLKECLRLLKPGGKLVVVTPNAESAGAELFGACWRGWEPPRHLRVYSVKSLTNLLRAAGFSLHEVRTSSAGAAVIYRVSAANQKKITGSVSFVFRLGLVFWSYWKELSEFRAQQTGRRTGQNLLACAAKPLNQTS
ncbi:MAG: class I SAM-dependent methyltransferase [Nitrosomonadales bacterium]|nr:class I SAM-dependent methyltransferase [Nitrosomonadales bacterium]